MSQLPTMPTNQTITTESVARAVERHLPGRTARAIEDRGVWIRHNIKVTLDDGADVWVKVHVHTEWEDGSEKEAVVSRLFTAHTLPAPRVLAVDRSCEIIPQPYVIQEHVGGMRLSALWERVDPTQMSCVYRALGEFYRKLHDIHYEHSGWITGTGQVLPFSPNDHMHQAQIVEGGQRAVARGLMDERTCRRLVDVMTRHLDYLKGHRPSLIHGNAFPWAIYLDRDARGEWAVAKLTDLGDVLYWDPAYDLTAIRYPPFGHPDAARWEAFVAGYGPAPEERRLKLYLLMQRVGAALGVYSEPPRAGNEAWRQQCLRELHQVMDDIDTPR